MADLGHELTDKKLKALEKRVAAEYNIAVKDMQGKLTEYLEKDEAKRKIQEQLYKDGKITKKEYQDWCYRHAMMGKRWEQMRDVLAEDLTHTNEIALGIIKNEMPDVYALNANYATYRIEHDAEIDTSFTLYNHDTAEYLLGDQRQLMPKPSARKAKEIAANKAMQWEQQKIQSAVLQGVLQGESPYKVAERLRSVGQMEYNASVRYARTMTTSAQNAGRYEAFHRAQRKGIDLTIEWQATLDSRTRHEHRQMHGQRTEVDEPFHTPDGYTIYYPADCTGESSAPQHEIWNCRCTLLAWVKGFEGDTVTSSPKMGDMSFEEWQNAKAPQSKQPTAKIEQGELPPHISEYKDYSEYRKAMEKYTGSRAYYTDGNEVFYGANYYGYTGNEFENVKEFSATIQQLHEQFPLPNKAGLDIGDYSLIDDYLTPTQVSRKTQDAAAQCWHNPNTGRYCIGYRPENGYQTYQQALAERQKHIDAGEILLGITDGSAQGIAAHEYGHGIADYITNAMVFEDPAAMEYWEWYKSLSKDEIRRGLSAYAATNRWEFEAECFAELLTPNPRPLALQYRDYLYRCMEANYNDVGKGEPALKAMENLIKRRNVSEIPTFILPRDEYKHIMSDLSTYVNQYDCPEGTMQFFTTFYEDNAYTYSFERTGKAEFRIVGKTVAKGRKR